MAASGCIPAHSGQFAIYEFLKDQMDSKNESFNMLKTLTIGGVSTFAHDFFQAPADIVKQRLQLCKHLTARKVVYDIIN